MTKTETIKIDSVYINKKEIVFAPIASKLTINDICDTLTGLARPFKSELVRGKDTIFVEVAGNDLNLSIDLDSLINSKVSEEKSKWEFNNKSEVRPEKYTPKIWYYIVGVLFLGWIFPVIPRFVNGVVRRLVGMG